MREHQRITPAQNPNQVSRLVDYIGQHAIDSERQPIQSEEIPTVIDLVIEQLVWKYPYLDQVLQETLDELRYRD